MSTVYGGGSVNYSPPGRVSFGWIGDAWTLFTQAAGVWVVAMLLMILIPMAILIGAGIGMGAFAAITTAQMNGTYNPANPYSAFGAFPIAFTILIFVFALLYVPFMYGGIYGMAVKQMRGEQIGVADVFSGGPAMLRMLGLSVVTALVGFVIQFVFGLLLGLAGAGAGAMFVHVGHASPQAGLGAFSAGAILIGLLYFVVILLFYALLLPTYAMIADGFGVFEALRQSFGSMGKDVFRGALLLFVFGLIYLLSAIPCGLGLFATLPMLFLLSALAYRDMVGMSGGSGPAMPAYGGYQPAQPGVWPPPPGQAPPPGAQPPPPQWGSTPQNPGGQPPRTTLGGDPIDPPPNRPPGT